MADEDRDLPLINLEKISALVSFYKFPLILAVLGALLTVISFAILMKNTPRTPEIIFGEATASAETYGSVKVDIEGSVVNPGVYEFNKEDRIGDAILAAGGLTEQADLAWIEKNINRAAKLLDGGKIYIPKKGDSGNRNTEVRSQSTESSLGAATGLININSATQAELESLPGVGPATAGKIIEARPYQTLEELKTKKAVGNALYDKIVEKLTI